MSQLLRLSASKLKMYQKCPRQYLARYRDKKDDGINIWGVVGTAAHKAIEEYYKSGADIAKGFLERTKHIDPNTGGYDEWAYKLMSSTYLSLKEFDPTQYEVHKVDDQLQLEKHFRLPYPNKENPICTLEGYIDHVTPVGFIDYKTGKDQPSKLGLRKDLQFIVYFWAYEQLYGKVPEYGIYYRLRDNRPIIAKTVEHEELDTIIQKFINDPMVYEMQPCVQCPLYCGVRKLCT